MSELYRTIVAGVDGSATAWAAAARAVELAARHDADLHLVSVVPPPDVGVALSGPGLDAVTARQDRARASAESALAFVAARAESVGRRATTHLEHGDPAARIVAVANAVGADLLVVGSKGLDPTGRYVLGSVPEEILLAAHRDVLVVRTTG